MSTHLTCSEGVLEEDFDLKGFLLGVPLPLPGALMALTLQCGVDVTNDWWDRSSSKHLQGHVHSSTPHVPEFHCGNFQQSKVWRTRPPEQSCFSTRIP